tara:strand:- start:13051 stop:13461 length:411 start_codon:yes stop_codon:yes gene_type:complete
MDETGQTRIDAVTCNVCDVLQPIAKFTVLTSGEVKRKCRSCKSGQEKVVQRLRKENLYPPDDYCCPICDRDMNEIGKYGQPMLSKWVLDHCHDTNTFRGWLCGNCNTGLGGFKDDSVKVERAYKYLKGHEDEMLAL